MANEEQLAILRQGVEVWNKWREENRAIFPDLSGADLTGGYLAKADFVKADLRKAILAKVNLMAADLRGCNLIEANFRDGSLHGANFENADLTGANFNRAYLIGADLNQANLSQADLSETDLRDTIFDWANLYEADLSNTILITSDFTRTNLARANLRGAEIGYVTFGYVDLSQTNGLEEVSHSVASTLGIDTIQLSKGNIPEAFLRGCGLSDLDIQYAKLYKPDLSNNELDEILYKIHDIRAHQALQISPLFISYSHGDSEFVDKVGNRLTDIGVRFWRDIHDMKAGQIEKQIDRAIRQNPTVLLVLSQNSLSSDWVEHEVRTARQLEKDIDRDVLCPIALDDSWKSSRWPARIMEQIKEYNILDFSQWEDDVNFEGMFRKLIDGLKLFYKG